jgi:hypothetical protein
MSIQAVLLPLFIQVFLTFGLGFWLARIRMGLVLRKEVRWQEIALRQKPWPEAAEKIDHSFQNQFEIPLLFYVLVILAIMTKTTDPTFVAMEWVFVGSRVAHALVHTTTNHVPTRFRIFAAGFVIVFLMWAMLAVRILSEPPYGIV